MRQLNFSSEYLNIAEVVIAGDFKITAPSIVVNLSDSPITVDTDKSTFSLLQSRLLRNTVLSSQQAIAVIIQTKGDNFLNISNEASLAFKNIWEKASILYPQIEELKKLTMHKSKKDTVNGYELNFWYLEEGSLGRIHQIHDFREVHTQILGTGLMQKYKEQSYESAFETTYMIPGFTHYPYFNKEGLYPWHSYNAITNCVWMAIEKHR